MTAHDFVDKTVERQGLSTTWSYQLIYCRRCGWVVKDETEAHRPAPPTCIDDKEAKEAPNSEGN